MTVKRVYGSVWYSFMDGRQVGIVTMNNGIDDKAYIGIVGGVDKELDIKYILERGTPFPFKQAIELTGGKLK